MMNVGILGIILLILNVLFSYKGFSNSHFFEQYKFEVDGILIKKEYYRFVSAGFLHVDWMHLILNMYTLYVFSGALENYLGILAFILIYFGSLIGGNVLALWIHKNHGDYNAVGASGALFGVVFASIILFPHNEIGFFGLPFFIPNWLFGLLYVLYTLFGISAQKDNIGHEAHLGGAIIGMLLTIVMQPQVIVQNYIQILMLLVPISIFIFKIVKSPLLVGTFNTSFKTPKKYYNIDHQYNAEKVEKQKEIDAILDKISKKGIDSLTSVEKQKLKEYSR